MQLLYGEAGLGKISDQARVVRIASELYTQCTAGIVGRTLHYQPRAAAAAGKPRLEAWRSMAATVSILIIARQFVCHVLGIQTERLGTPDRACSQPVNADGLRTRRLMLAEEHAAKIEQLS